MQVGRETLLAPRFPTTSNAFHVAAEDNHAARLGGTTAAMNNSAWEAGTRLATEFKNRALVMPRMIPTKRAERVT